MDSSTVVIAFMGLPGGMEWVLILLLGLLLFGRRLPQVGRSVGETVVEFRKGIKGIEDDIDDSSDKPAKKKIEAPSGESKPVPESEKAEPSEPAKPHGDPVDERRVSKADEVE
ncbi:MAG: twin-arginine translocase TatA/TatE family subunit [Phycisphaerales bacterium]